MVVVATSLMPTHSIAVFPINWGFFIIKKAYQFDMLFIHQFQDLIKVIGERIFM